MSSIPMVRRSIWLWAACAMLGGSSLAAAADAAAAGELTEELPTLRCLGAQWLIGGDDNRNARVEVEYRTAGEPAWRKAMDLFRVDGDGMRPAARPPAGQTLFAGSILGLREDTDYEVRLSLKDADGGEAVRTLKMRTWAEPKLPTGGRRVDVRPGGLAAALKQAKPGDTLLLHKGVYTGTFNVSSGEPDAPIVLRDAGDGEAILDGNAASNALVGTAPHDVMIHGLAFRNAKWAMAFNGGSRITVRRCKVTGCEYAFVAQTQGARQQRIFICDNEFVGPSAWPRTKGIEDARGVQVSGTGHVVCYNRVRGYGDAIDTFSNYPCSAIDFHNNEISECTDDGIEMDFSEHNTRCFENRLTNCFQGISIQPLNGGPVYIYRNALYNVEAAPFKMHNSPSGGLFLHNTCVKAGMPLLVMTNAPVRHCITRNNLFVGTEAGYAFESTAPMRDCDFDYDGFAGTWKTFLKWNGKRYASMEDLRKDGPIYRHAALVEAKGLFASGAMPPPDVKKQYEPAVNDLRLAPGSAAVDAGTPLPTINDGFAGRAPDLGAFELGAALPHYGPRPPQPDEKGGPGGASAGR